MRAMVIPLNSGHGTGKVILRVVEG